MAKAIQNNILKDNRKRNFTIVENFIVDLKLKWYEKLTYIVLSRMANRETKKCFPSYPKIAELVNCSERTAFTAIQNLVDKGFITKATVGNKNVYTLVDILIPIEKTTSQTDSDLTPQDSKWYAPNENQEEMLSQEVQGEIHNNLASDARLGKETPQVVQGGLARDATLSPQGMQVDLASGASEQDELNNTKSNNTNLTITPISSLSINSESSPVEDEVVGTTALYEKTFGPFQTDREREIVSGWSELFPHDWIVDAIRKAADKHIRNVTYVDALMYHRKTVSGTEGAEASGAGRTRSGEYPGTFQAQSGTGSSNAIAQPSN